MNKRDIKKFRFVQELWLYNHGILYKIEGVLWDGNSSVFSSVAQDKRYVSDITIKNGIRKPYIGVSPSQIKTRQFYECYSSR